MPEICPRAYFTGRRRLRRRTFTAVNDPAGYFFLGFCARHRQCAADRRVRLQKKQRTMRAYNQGDGRFEALIVFLRCTITSTSTLRQPR
jgi:hypothetical protein